MPLISARFLSLMAEPLEREGLPLERWIEGLDVRPEQVLRPEVPMEWSCFMELLERAARHLGGPEEIESFMYRWDSVLPGGMRSVLGMLVSLERVYETVAKMVIDQASPPLRVQRRIRPGHATLDMSVDDGERVSPVLWYAMRGFVRRVPHQLGMADPVVVSSFHGRGAHYEISFSSQSLYGRLRRRLRMVAASRRLIEEFEEQQRDLQSTLRDLERQTQALRDSEARNRALVEQLEQLVEERTGELAASNEELHELQRRLIRAERLGAAEELAGSVAHAINNPLTALIGQLQMVLESADPPDPRIARLHQVAQRIRDVVSRTLQLFRQGQLDLASEDPEQILDDVAASMRALAERSGVAIQLKSESGIPPIVVDGALLRAALGSLAENAVEASPQGGVVELELSSIPAMGVVEFRISDAGPGIPPSMRRKVVRPFFTTKSGGTGLGLAIARGIVAGHHGRLRLLRRPGGGTIAAVELPIALEGVRAGSEA